MEAFNFKVNHLLEPELDYELKIRRTFSERPVADKRKILTRILNREINEPGKMIQIGEDTLSIKEEKAGIEKSLNSIQNVIDSYDGDPNDSLIHRVQSRLSHVAGRVQRIPKPDNEEEASRLFKYVQDTVAMCLLMEANLTEKIAPGHELQQSAITTPVINVPAPIVNCAARNIPVSEWQLKFNGDSKRLYPFLERLTEMAQARNVSENELFNSAVEFFVGDAFTWFRYIKSSVHDWHSLVEKLKKDFLHCDYDEELWSEIKRRKQKKNESTVIFIANMESLFCRLSTQPLECTKIKWIRRNILPSFVNRLALLDINSLTELSELCRKLEESDYLLEKSRPKSETTVHQVDNAPAGQSGVPTDKKSNPSRNSNRNRKTGKSSSIKVRSTVTNRDDKPVPSKTSIICWNCEGPNHTYQGCTAPKRVFCFKCGTAGVKSASCLNCTKNE